MAKIPSLLQSTAKTKAQALVSRFKTRTTSSPALSQFEKKDIVRGITKRINNPSKIAQDEASLCGPAAFYYMLTVKRPDLFAKAAIDLYTTGKATLGNLTINPGTSMKKYSLPASSVNPVDWIILASLRDSSNAFFNYDEITDGFAGITFPGELVDWYEKVGFAATNKASAFMVKGIDNLLRAHQARRNNQTVSLLINGKILKRRKYKKGQMAMFPTHWVVLNSDVLVDNKPLTPATAPQLKLERENSQIEDVDDDNYTGKEFVHNVSFSVYSWGKSSWKLGGNVGSGKIDLDTFLNNYFGFVSIAF